MIRLLSRLHAFVYRRSNGRLLGNVGGQPVLLLRTLGRRSGRWRLTPVQHLADGSNFVVVAANHGAAQPPSWCLNLRASHAGQVQLGRRRTDVVAKGADGALRAELWERLIAANRYLERTEVKAGHVLPVIVLTPT